jgi:type II secretory pathway pseudopilin PulG
MSLVEVMVAVTLLTLIMGVVLSLFAGLRKRDRAFRQQSERARHALRLVDALRHDIRRGASVTQLAADSLLIAADGREIKYTLTPNGCERLSAGRGAARELFSIGAHGAWAFDQGPPGNKPLAIVRIKHSQANPDHAEHFPFLVCAAIGADAALERPAAPQNETTPPSEAEP